MVFVSELSELDVITREECLRLQEQGNTHPLRYEYLRARLNSVLPQTLLDVRDV